jgi:hypothetical protein
MSWHESTYSHVARQRVDEGTKSAAKDLRGAYESWCTKQGHAPLSVPKFAAELKGLGYVKWKSVGVMRYRDLRFAA